MRKKCEKYQVERKPSDATMKKRILSFFDRLEIGGSFAEFHPIDFERDTVLVGHDGPHHLNIAQSKPVLRSLKKYHGKPGKGAGVETVVVTPDTK